MMRRTFLQGTLAYGAATTLGGFGTPPRRGRRPLADRMLQPPVDDVGFDEALRQIKAAGYETTGLLTRTKDEPFIGADATPEYLAGLKQRLAASGLKANMGALRSRHDVPLDDSIKEVRRQIDNADNARTRLPPLVRRRQAGRIRPLLQGDGDAAAYAHERQIKLVMKPHGGSSGASDEIVAAIKAVRHPNFKIWYDAGNIIYYTGKDPVEELKPIAQHVTGFCAKDCGALEGRRDDSVRYGKVDFAAVFRR